MKKSTWFAYGSIAGVLQTFAYTWGSDRGGFGMGFLLSWTLYIAALLLTEKVEERYFKENKDA